MSALSKARETAQAERKRLTESRSVSTAPNKVYPIPTIMRETANPTGTGAVVCAWLMQFLVECLTEQKRYTYQTAACTPTQDEICRFLFLLADERREEDETTQPQAPPPPPPPPHDEFAAKENDSDTDDLFS